MKLWCWDFGASLANVYRLDAGEPHDIDDLKVLIAARSSLKPIEFELHELNMTHSDFKKIAPEIDSPQDMSAGTLHPMDEISGHFKSGTDNLIHIMIVPKRELLFWLD